MSYANTDGYTEGFYDHCLQNGLSKEVFLSKDNIEKYIAASVDAYRDYPLFLHVFGGRYDEKTLGRMMSVDFRSRLGVMVGIASGNEYESIMMIEPPLARKTGMAQYVKAANAADYSLIFKPAIYRQEDYEKFALNKRRAYLDEKTWYIYIFATRKEYQHKGHGKKLMNLMLSFADSTGSRLCLETNLSDNVGMYEHFGFKIMDSSTYKNALEHYVMLYTGKKNGADDL
ncbi:MAG: GNAT family N-acetyltransferase [Lachnospiraceae bacterium]|nr:GNAT family N-acetyltransferase [Lachnospiraceae bacterium]